MSGSPNRPQIDPEEVLEGIRGWVEIETPTLDGAAVNRLVDRVEKDMRAFDAWIERIPGQDGYGDILKARTPWGGDGPGILVLGHLDTVHPLGTLNILPFRRDGDSVYGPGIYDMKGGAYLCYHACLHLARLNKPTPLPITFLFNPDEEVGSPTSRQAIEEEARKAKYVLIAEPGRDGAKVVTERKGVARFQVTVNGRPAHSGAYHAEGRSAIKEMARQILRIEEMTDYDRGITTNVGTVSGGTTVNVVPARCVADVDVRIEDKAAGEEMCQRILNLEPFDPDLEIRVEGEVNRPPFFRSEDGDRLFEHARALASELGFEISGIKTGGGSDGNYSAALGIPTLDGLGVNGRDMHTQRERLFFSSIAPRAALIIRLFETLE